MGLGLLGQGLQGLQLPRPSLLPPPSLAAHKRRPSAVVNVTVKKSMMKKSNALPVLHLRLINRDLIGADDRLAMPLTFAPVKPPPLGGHPQHASQPQHTGHITRTGQLAGGIPRASSAKAQVRTGAAAAAMHSRGGDDEFPPMRKKRRQMHTSTGQKKLSFAKPKSSRACRHSCKDKRTCGSVSGWVFERTQHAL